MHTIRINDGGDFETTRDAADRGEHTPDGFKAASVAYSDDDHPGKVCLDVERLPWKHIYFVRPDGARVDTLPSEDDTLETALQHARNNARANETAIEVVFTDDSRESFTVAVAIEFDGGGPYQANAAALGGGVVVFDDGDRVVAQDEPGAAVREATMVEKAARDAAYATLQH